MNLNKYYILQIVSVLALVIAFYYGFTNLYRREFLLIIIPLLLVNSYLSYKIDTLRSDVASSKLFKIIFIEKSILFIIFAQLFLVNSLIRINAIIASYYSFVYISYMFYIILLLVVYYLKRKEENFLKRK